jgi:TolC family type I secretion outer membrane protein
MREFTKLILLALIVPTGLALTSSARAGDDMPSPEPGSRSPLSLEHCVALALENHPALRGAAHDVEGARAGVRAVRASALPQVSVSGSYTQNGDTPGTGGAGASQEGYTAALSVRQLLFDSGRTPALIHEAESGRDAISATRDEVEQAVVFGARQSYFGVLAAGQVLEAQTQARDLSALHLKVAQARYQEGIAPKADVTKAEVELSNAELDLIRAQNGVSLAYAALSNALGLPATTSLTVTGDLQSPGAQPALETSLAFAYQNRPELKRADASLQAARSAVAVAASGTRPSLYATASTNWLDNSAVSDSGYAAGVALSFPLWDGGGTAARTRQARAEVASSQAASDNAKQQVGLEVQQSCLNVVEADQRVATAEKLVTQAEENHRIAQGRYESGVDPMIDVVDAETALTAARTDYAQARYDAHVTRARLDLAVGSRFRPEGATSEN